MEVDHLSKPFDWRAQNARSLEPTIDALCKDYRDYLRGDNTDYRFRVARQLHDKPAFKRQVEAMLLAGFSSEECAAKFKIGPEIVDTYKQLFFDLDTKNSEAECLEAVMNDPSYSGDQFKVVARLLGREALMFTLGYKTNITKESSDNIRRRLEYALLLQCARIELIDPEEDQQFKIILKAIETLGKLESTKADAALSNVQQILSTISDKLTVYQGKPKRSREDLGI